MLLNFDLNLINVQIVRLINLNLVCLVKYQFFSKIGLIIYLERKGKLILWEE